MNSSSLLVILFCGFLVGCCYAKGEQVFAVAGSRQRFCGFSIAKNFNLWWQ